MKEYVTIDSVRKAIKRAKAIVQNNHIEHKPQENYKGFQFFRDNPDVNVHEVVKIIFDVCGLEF